MLFHLLRFPSENQAEVMRDRRSDSPTRSVKYKMKFLSLGLIDVLGPVSLSCREATPCVVGWLVASLVATHSIAWHPSLQLCPVSPDIAKCRLARRARLSLVENRCVQVRTLCSEPVLV